MAISFEQFIKKAGGKPEEIKTVAPPERNISNDQGFFAGVKESFKERTDKGSDAILADQSLPSKALQTVGQGAGFVGDIGVEALKAVSPQFVEDFAKKGVEKIASQPIVQQTTEAYANWKKNHPEAAANLEAVANIGSLLPVGKGASVATKGIGKGVDLGFDAAKTGKNLLGKGIEKTGQKIQFTAIKPSQLDVKDGFKVENIGKYDLGGSLPETITKGHIKMNQLTQELQQKLEGSNSSIDLNKVAEITEERLLSNKARSFGDVQAVSRVFENLRSEIESVAGKNGLVNMVDATNVKRGAGTKGSWAYNRPEPDASAVEKVYSEFYTVLKEEIEKAAPEGVKGINQQLSDIIPIYNAAIRRLPVEQRNNALSLTDNLGLFSAVFDPKALLILGATKSARSGRVGNLLQKAGSKLQAD